MRVDADSSLNREAARVRKRASHNGERADSRETLGLLDAGTGLRTPANSQATLHDAGPFVQFASRT